MYGAAFLFLIFLAELPMEQRALDIIPAYRYRFLSFEQKNLYSFSIYLEI